ncbi:MAG: Ig-like domain-containing protein [Nitrospirae bacterium]|nr:Ig-like domain-containing protein [Nitrospirota bacterium]
MKKILSALALFTALVMIAGCSSGSNLSSEPAGNNPGLPSIVQLLPLQYIAQTNSYLYFKAKVLDGNGSPVPNVNVTFTNLSTLGVLGDIVAKTNSIGLATVTLYSTTSGFATVQAEVNTGAGQVRDKKTVFFSLFDLVFPPSTATATSLVLEVDGDNDGVFGETSDLSLFENSSDNQVIVRATVGGTSNPVTNSLVTFGADVPYRIGSDPSVACSDGSTVCEVTFPITNERTTDSNGQASVLVQVVPNTLRTFNTVVNITASADNNAFNMVSLFLNPVTVGTLTISANPLVVDSGGTADISAKATTSAGNPVPEGTMINFTTDVGGIDPFIATDADGIAVASFKAPTLLAGSLGALAHITASVGGRTATTNVVVNAPPAGAPPAPPALLIVPGTAAVSDAACPQTVTFIISGGTPTYITTSSDPTLAVNLATGVGVWNGSTITVTVPCYGAVPPLPALPVTVNIDVYDSVGGTDQAVITIVP